MTMIHSSGGSGQSGKGRDHRQFRGLRLDRILCNWLPWQVLAGQGYGLTSKASGSPRGMRVLRMYKRMQPCTWSSAATLLNILRRRPIDVEETCCCFAMESPLSLMLGVRKQVIHRCVWRARAERPAALENLCREFQPIASGERAHGRTSTNLRYARKLAT